MLKYLVFGRRKIDETDSYVMWEVMGPGMEQPKVIIDYYPQLRSALIEETESVH